MPASVKRHAKTGYRFEARPRNTSIGNDYKAQMDLTHFVRWPRYVRIQRQRRVLQKRLKTPGQILQFRRPVEKHIAKEAVRFAAKYQPETRKEKALRLRALAQLKADGKPLPDAAAPHALKFGINNVASLVERKKAKLVLIAHDVDPLDLVLWLPALCHRMGVPYAIVRGKSRLGQLVHMKTCAAVAITGVAPADQREFAKLLETVDDAVDYARDSAPLRHTK